MKSGPATAWQHSFVATFDQDAAEMFDDASDARKRRRAIVAMFRDLALG